MATLRNNKQQIVCKPNRWFHFRSCRTINITVHGAVLEHPKVPNIESFLYARKTLVTLRESNCLELFTDHM